MFGGKFLCSRCQQNPNFKAVWGCEPRKEKQDKTVMRGGMVYIEKEGDVKTIYYNCPTRFIPQSVIGLITIMEYYQKYPGAPMPAIEDVSLRFLIASRYYDGKFNEYQIEQIKNKDK